MLADARIQTHIFPLSWQELLVPAFSGFIGPWLEFCDQSVEAAFSRASPVKGLRDSQQGGEGSGNQLLQ